MTKLLLDILNVKVCESTLSSALEEHPNYPSLLCVSDVLNAFHVENMALRIDDEGFKDIAVPFITQIAGKNGAALFLR